MSSRNTSRRKRRSLKRVRRHTSRKKSHKLSTRDRSIPKNSYKLKSKIQSSPKSSKQLTYLSLFSGIGGFECGIHEIFPNARCMGYSEINPYSIKVYQEHFPDHKNLGDVSSIKGEKLEKLKGRVDLLVGGSPCQNFSKAGDRKGLDGQKSSLLMEYVRILNELNPKYFILENVQMSKDHQEQVSELLGVDPVLIDSNIASYQRRKRLYWCNFDISKLTTLPPISGTMSSILLKETDSRTVEVPHKTIGKSPKRSMEKRISSILRGKPIAQSNWFKIIKRGDKSMRTLLKGDACYEWVVIKGFNIRQIHPLERERLQTFPDDWTSSLSRTQRYEVLGDAVSCDVIALIMKKLKDQM